MATKNNTALKKLHHAWYCMVHQSALGVPVCDRWRVFENFYADMGDRPQGMSLYRIDGTGPFSPENCKWNVRGARARCTPILDRFMSKFERIPWSGCWIWFGSSATNKYGRALPLIYVRGAPRAQPAYRVAYELFVGPIPKEMQVCHKCDISLCVNPEHLFLGTAADNQLDKVRKNRHTKGETHGVSKLKNGDVLAIRSSSEKACVLAALYRCSESLIYQIKSRAIWTHLP